MLKLWFFAVVALLTAGAEARAEPISAAIVTAVGLTGAAATAATAAGTFVISTGLSVGLSYLARSLGKKATNNSSASQNAATLSLTIDANQPRQLVFGGRAVGGSLHYFCKSGPYNENLDLIIVLADHEIDSLQQVWVNDTAIAMHMDGDGFQDVTDQKFCNKYGVPQMSFRLHKGRTDQSGDDIVELASGGQWTDAHALKGCAYVHVRIIWDNTVWGSALPTFKWLINGLKLYDPRRDSTMPGGLGPMRWGQPDTYAFSDNLELCRYNYLRGIYVNGDRWFGVGLSAADIDLDQTYAAIAACEEMVPLRFGGAEPRYRCAAVISASETHREVLNKFSTACAGNLPDLSGRYSLRPGVAELPVISFTDADLIADADLTGSRHRSLGEVISEVTGTFADPAALYQTGPVPTRYSSADEDADGGYRRSDAYDLDYVYSQTQGQRCLEIFRRLARRQRTHTLTLRRRFSVLEAGDWVVWTSDKFAYDQVIFRVEAFTLNADWTVTLQLRAIDSVVYEWDAEEDELDPANPHDLPSAGPLASIVVNVAVAIAKVVGIDGTQQPGIRVTWNPISDPTVYGLLIEYRRVGDVPWQTYRATEEEARTGAATITAGVIGGDFYQARVTPLTSPRRAVDVSATVTTAANTEEIIVTRSQVSTVTEAVRPGAITNDALEADLRAAFDASRYANIDAMTIGLLLAAANTAAEKELAAKADNALRADVALGLNPISAGIERIDQKAAEITAAFAQADVAITAQLAGVSAALQTEESSRVTAVSAVANSVTDLTAQLGSDIAGVQQQITAQSEAGKLLAQQTSSLYVQDIQGDDAALVAQLVEMAARGEDTTDLLRKNNVATAGISEVRKAAVDNGVAIASIRTDLLTEIGARGASIASEMSARTSADEALAHQITTLVAQEASDRGAVVQEERTARISGDNALASQISTLVAMETSERQASIVSEQQARVNGDSALASSITYVSTRVDGVSASGNYGIAGVAGLDGAAISYRIVLNAGTTNIYAAMRLDAMGSGTSRAVFEVGAFYIQHPAVGGGSPVPVFAVENNYFTMNGNVQINGNLLVTGTVSWPQIAENSGIVGVGGTAGNLDMVNGGGAIQTDWMNIGAPLVLPVATQGGYVRPAIIIKTAMSASKQIGAVPLNVNVQVRVIGNGSVLYEAEVLYNASDGFNENTKPSSISKESIDFFDAYIAGRPQTYQIQVKYYKSANITGTMFAKIIVMSGGR